MSSLDGCVARSVGGRVIAVSMLLAGCDPPQCLKHPPWHKGRAALAHGVRPLTSVIA